MELTVGTFSPPDAAAPSTKDEKNEGTGEKLNTASIDESMVSQTDRA